MSTVPTAAPSSHYPLRFESTDGPSFHRIADAARYYHDSEVQIPLRFTGVLTDTRTGKARKARLTADAYGFYSGNGHEEGDMNVFITFRGHLLRFGPNVHYNWRTRRFGWPLELSPLAKKQ